MIDKKRLKWTKKDDKAVKQFKRDLKDGKIKTIPFDEAVKIMRGNKK